MSSVTPQKSSGEGCPDAASPSVYSGTVPHVVENDSKVTVVSSTLATNVTQESQVVMSASNYWLDFAKQSRLRIDNMQTMHRLAFSSARARWASQTIPEQIPLSAQDQQKETPCTPRECPKASAPHPIDGLPNEIVELLGKVTLKSRSRASSNANPLNQRILFHQLPDDILFSIFSCLSFPEIVAAQRVSKEWLSYLVTEPRLYRYVSFLDSKHQIPLKTLRAAIAISKGRLLSMEFNASTLVHLTPLAPIYPHLRRLVITHQTGFMSTVFRIAFRKEDSREYFNLPNLRTAVFHQGMLLNNEVVTLLSMAPNLEELECRSALVKLDLLDLTDNTTQWKLKRLNIKHYSEEMSRLPLGLEESVRARLIRTPAILRFLPYLEELTLGIDSLQVMDLTWNPRIQYLDFLPCSAVTSFIQPPASLQVCLNAPVLNRHLPDSHPIIWPPAENQEPKLIGEHVQLWTNPPPFVSLSLSCVPSHIEILPRALCNSYDSLTALRIKFLSWSWSVRSSDSERVITQQLDHLPEILNVFENLRFLDISDSKADDVFLVRLSPLSLEYLCLARTSVTSRGVLHFLSKSQGILKEVNVVDTQVGGDVVQVAENLGVKMEFIYPGHPMPREVHSLY